MEQSPQTPRTPEARPAGDESQGLFPWRFMARSLAPAFRLRVLLLAAVGVTVGAVLVTPPSGLVPGPASSGVHLVSWGGAFEGVLLTPLAYWRWLTGAIAGLTLAPDGGILGVARAVGLVVWWSLVGGAISQIAAADLTHRPPAALFAAMAASARQLLTRCLPLLAVGLAVAALMIPLWLHGLAMRVPVLGVLSALLLPIPLALAAVGAVLLVLLAVNWLILMACPAVEQTDAFDATSRAFAYVTQRPVRLLGYLLTALFVAAPISLASSAVAQALSWVALECLPAVTTDPTPADRLAAFWFTTLAARLPVIVLAAYTWSAAVAVYLLLRRDVDGVQVDELDPRA
ncbi:hypothetical protein Pla123a_23330 [Posidoniimonas polymericola]|uniref:Uncharacterized protein n=1 Tax=Posidoniimonas polymericola TaxID=2528002 RepID=A0A5C5YQ42_9BACT|nr:hypothetical protein Pla123a_23330 [Posidoniimonas polymericola]